MGLDELSGKTRPQGQEGEGTSEALHENSIYVFPEKELHSFIFHIHVSVSDLYT